MTDITERKRNEEQTRRLKSELEARIVESNAARQTALGLAKLRSEFLANTSHETRAPLNTIIGLTELVLDTDLSPGQRMDLETIGGAANSLLATLNNILDFSQISARQLALQNTEFEPAAVFEHVTDTVAILARRKGLELGLAIEQEVPTNAYGDPYRLQQVLTNLVGNAIKFTERGCVTVRVALKSATDLAVTLRCVVRDTGIGIAPDARQRLFQPFSQVDGSTTRRFRGTGLGLAIASQLVARMGGKIGAESKAGIGSSFWFTVQFRRAERPRKMSEHWLLADRRVLIVSTLDQIRQLLADQISSWGIHSVLVSSAKELFAMLVNHADDHPFHMVLAHLPGEEASKLTQLIRSERKLAGTRIIWIPTVDASHQVTPDSVHHVLPGLIKPTELLGILTALSAQILSSEDSKDLLPSQREPSHGSEIESQKVDKKAQKPGPDRHN
jgi:nitrogen-specific signal transduction histidine kinase